MTYAPTASESPLTSVASYPSWDRLRELAGVRLDGDLALTMYLNLDPRDTSTIPDLAARVNSLVDEAVKRAREAAEDMDHDSMTALEDVVEEAASYLYDFDHRSHGGPGHVHGLAVFSAPANFLPLLLPARVEDEVSLGRAFHLAPLVGVLGRSREALVVFVSREQGRVHLLRGGTITEIDDHSEEIHGQHDQGGWSQARYQRSVENEFRDHLRDVAAGLERLCQRDKRPLVLLGPEDTKGEMLRVLDNHAPNAHRMVAAWGHAEAHANAEELARQAAPLLEGWWAEKERELVDSWQEAQGQGGRGVSGWEATLEAASDGRVEVLLYDDAEDRQLSRPAAYECPACGRAAPSARDCPLDGTPMERREQGLDLAIQETLRYGGKVWAVRKDQRVGAVEGVAALCRY